jgi:ribonuclease BN (tRNA processing enzyme)
VGRVIFLGTGDPLNAERAQSSLAVRLPGGETILFDASSGTILLGRLRDADIPIEEVRHLFVSHRHFDHTGGLAPLLISMATLPAASLTIYALPGTLKALRELLALTIPGVEDWLGDRLNWRELAPGKPILLENTEMTPFLVDHSVECVATASRRTAPCWSSPPTPGRAGLWSNTRGTPTSSSTKPTVQKTIPSGHTPWDTLPRPTPARLPAPPG